MKFTEQELKLVLEFMENVQKVILEKEGEELDKDELISAIFKYKEAMDGEEIKEKEINSFAKGYLSGYLCINSPSDWLDVMEIYRKVKLRN